MRDTDLRNPAFLKGGEIGSTVKNWAEIDVKIALCDPLPYLVSQGIPACQIMYNIINAEPKGLAERVYLPDGDIRVEINGKREELRSLENKAVVRNFDVVAISIYTEMQYLNISWLLNAARLNILGSERTEDDPIVIVGGMNLNNPCPLGDIVDIAFIGESDNFWHQFIELISDCKKKGLNKNDTLKECMKLPGCWVPRFYSEIHDEKGTHTVPAIPEAPKEVVSQVVDLSKRPANDICNSIISNVYDSYAKSIEIARGCRHGCRFCLMAYSRRPYRERNPEDIEQALDDRYMKGYHTVTLISPNATEFGDIDRIVQSTFDRGLTTKIQTERVDTFTDEKLAEVRRESGQVQMTLAIECATEEMRLRINKHITEKQITRALEVAIRSGYKWIKFMAMCNLPMESDDDKYELVNLMDRLLIKRDEIATELGVERPLLFLSVSPFLPKPFTPLQWSGLNPNEAKLVELRRRLRDIEGWEGEGNYEGKGTPRKFTWVIVGCDRHRKINSVFCLGDRRVGNLIEWMFRKKKDIFEKDFKGVKVSTWNDLVIKGNQLGMDIEEFYKDKDLEKELPWEFIKMPITRQFLLDEYENYKTATETLSCDKLCSHCGACSITPIAKRPDKEIKKVLRSRDKPNVEDWLFIEATKTEATRFLSYRSIEQILRCLMRNAGIIVYRIETSDMKIADSDRLMGKIWIDIAAPDIDIISSDLFSKYITVETMEKRKHRTVYYLNSFTVKMEQATPISLYESFKEKEEFNLILDNSGWRRSSNKTYNVIDRIDILKTTETEVIMKITCGDSIKVSPYEVARRIAGKSGVLKFRDVEGEIIGFSTKLEFGAESLLNF